MTDDLHLNAINVVKSFTKIGGEIEPHTDPKLGAFLVNLAKSGEDLERFRQNPVGSLESAGLDPSLVKVDVLQRVVESVADRLANLRINGPAMQTMWDRESSSHQDRNFDHSSSWFVNRDGYNVMYDAGHSTEQSTGQQAGQDRSFSGAGLEGIEAAIRQDLNTLFFPAQPLVTPELVDKIKSAAKEIEG